MFAYVNNVYILSNLRNLDSRTFSEIDAFVVLQVSNGLGDIR